MKHHLPMTISSSVRSSARELWYWSPIGYAAFILASPYYLFRMIAARKYRMGLRQRLTFFTREEKQRLQSGPTIWIHAVSVGELMAARPLLKRLKTEFPLYKILVTTVTDTGQMLAHDMEEVDEAIYLPLDLYPLCRKVMEWIHPVCLLIMETEMWPNFIRTAADLQIPLFLINARLSNRSFANYFRFKFFFTPLVNRFTQILAQSEEDRRRFLLLGAPENRISTMGNIKFEAAPAIDNGDLCGYWRTLFQIGQNEILLLGGSTFPGEESLLVRTQIALRREGIPLRLAIAPRHVERIGAIVEELKPVNVPIALRSTISNEATIDPDSIILLDTIGELRHVYAAADLVFIGKSIYGRGGQNPIEAAVWGKPILFGKNMQNFRDIAALFTQANAALCLDNAEELTDACRSLCLSPEMRMQMGQNAMQVVAGNRGALDRALGAIASILQKVETTG